MIDNKRITDIEQRLAENNYIDGREDIAFLLDTLRTREQNIKRLSQQILELNQEIENVKSDFGSSGFR